MQGGHPFYKYSIDFSLPTAANANTKCPRQSSEPPDRALLRPQAGVMEHLELDAVGMTAIGFFYTLVFSKICLGLAGRGR